MSTENGELSLYPQQFDPIGNFYGQHLVSAKQLDRAAVELVCERAAEIDELLQSRKGREKLSQSLNTLHLGSLFYEPSTRTRGMVEIAMARCGGDVFTETDVKFSSRTKGEPLAHTIRVMSGYNDAIVIRDPQKGFLMDVLPYAQCPIINGGDGDREHPLQALKDLYSFKKDFGKIDGLTVTFMGDIRYSRVDHSTALALSGFDVKVNLIAPNRLRAPLEMVNTLRQREIPVNEFESLRQMEEAGQEVGDVLYVTRLQIERLNDGTQESNAIIASLKSLYKTDYIIRRDWLERHPGTFLYHPLPIDRSPGLEGEIPVDLDHHRQSRFFNQSDNGIPVSAAVLQLILLG